VIKGTHIGVIGAGKCSKEIYALSEEVGSLVGKNGWLLICGGLGGVMEGAAKGCSNAGGITVGILPEKDKTAANQFINIPISTGMGEGRNLLVVRASDIIIAISGGYGTLSEIGLALRIGKPLIGLKTWPNINGIDYVETPQAAIEKVINYL
jgi:uncharacterized protein (TIGR00725 family)